MNGYPNMDEDTRSHGQICSLLEDGRRCSRPAGNASYSKKIQKTVNQRRLRLNMDHSVRHTYICDYHKDMIQSVRAKRKRKDSDDDISGDDDRPEIGLDFFQIPVNTLRRYKRHYKLQTRPGLNKSQLADSVSKHFRTIPVIEKEVLTFFIYMAKNYKNRFDQKHLEESR